MRFLGKGEEEEPDTDDVVFDEIEDDEFDESRYDSVLEMTTYS